MKISWMRICMPLIMIIAFGYGSLVAAQSTATVEIRPSTGAYKPGDQIEVELWVANVENLYGADVQLQFDSDKLTVVDDMIVPQSEFLNPQVIAKQTVDEVNGVGKIWYATTQLFPTMPVSGSGVLFTFTFEVVAEGATAVTITDQILATSVGEIIPAEVIDATYLLGEDVAYRIFLPVTVTTP